MIFRYALWSHYTRGRAGGLSVMQRLVVSLPVSRVSCACQCVTGYHSIRVFNKPRYTPFRSAGGGISLSTRRRCPRPGDLWEPYKRARGDRQLSWHLLNHAADCPLLCAAGGSQRSVWPATPARSEAAPARTAKPSTDAMTAAHRVRPRCLESPCATERAGPGLFSVTKNPALFAAFFGLQGKNPEISR